MNRNNISDKLKNYKIQFEKWQKSMLETKTRVISLESQQKVYDWFDRYAEAKREYEKICELKPVSSEHDLMYKLAGFLYRETITRTSECMMTFDLNEVDEVLNQYIDFDQYTADYVLSLIHQIGGKNVLQSDYHSGQFEITLGFEIIEIHRLKNDADLYVNAIVNFVDQRDSTNDSEPFLVEWSEFDKIFSDFEVFSFDEESTIQEKKQYEATCYESDFTNTLVKILDNHYAFSEIETKGIRVDLSGYYA